MPRFVIDLGDIDMSPEDVQALNGDLQKTALGYLSGLKFERPVAIRFPWEWQGIVLRRDVDDVFKAEEEIVAGLGDVRVGRSF